MAISPPSLKSIEAFVAAAQQLSFTRAAASLHITVSAISRRIHALEATLGVRLFHRLPHAIRLTTVGETYLSRLTDALDTIRVASDQAGTRHQHQALRISLPRSLAANWLIPRLAGFHARHKGIFVDLLTFTGEADHASDDADLVVRCNGRVQPGWRMELLFESALYPVCSPEFFADGSFPMSPSDLIDLPLLGLGGASSQWTAWLLANGVQETPIVRHTLDDLDLVYRAAMSGLGIAMGLDVVVEPYVESGKLVRLCERNNKPASELSIRYCVYASDSDILRRPAMIFRNWLLMEATDWRISRSLPEQERVGARLVPSLACLPDRTPEQMPRD
jgi:LysR family glycine cleavage system transcriptional activator